MVVTVPSSPLGHRAATSGRVAGLHHVAVTASDLDRSIHFYRDLLGLPLLAQGESDGPEMSAITGLEDVRLRWAEFDLGDDQLLELLEYISPRGKRLVQRTCDPGSAHIALAVYDLDELRGRLVAGGMQARSDAVTIEEPGHWYGVRSVYVLDPDGVTVELVEEPSRSRQGRRKRTAS